MPRTPNSEPFPDDTPVPVPITTMTTEQPKELEKPIKLAPFTMELRRSITHKYADNTLDNMVATAMVSMTGDQSIDSGRLSDALYSIGDALGCKTTLSPDGFVAYSTPSFGYSKPVESSSSGGGRQPAGNAGGYSSNTPRSNPGGGDRKAASYSNADKDAMWRLWIDDEAGNFFFTNFDTDNQFPNIKPMTQAFEHLGLPVPAPADVKPLYVKNCPDFAKQYV